MDVEFNHFNKLNLTLINSSSGFLIVDMRIEDNIRESMIHSLHSWHPPIPAHLFHELLMVEFINVVTKVHHQYSIIRDIKIMIVNALSSVEASLNKIFTKCGHDWNLLPVY